MQKHWYLGFLGLIGFYKLQLAVAPFSGQGPWSDALNLLWFLWFSYFLPKQRTEKSDG